MMSKDEVKRYIELHGDAREVIDTIKAMKDEGVDVTEESLDERLNGVSGEELDELEGEFYKSDNRPAPVKVILVGLILGILIGVAISIGGSML